MSALKWKGKPQRIESYDGENVWNGEWFAGPLYPGDRRIIVCRPSDSPFPKFLDSKCNILSVGGLLREVLTRYLEDNRHKDFVLDGRVGIRDGDRGFTVFKKSNGEPVQYPVLYLDDVVPLSVFQAGEGTHSLLKRRKRLRAIVDDIDSNRVFMTKYTRIKTKKQFREIRQNVAAVRNFGLILRKDSPYRSGRSGNVFSIRPDGE